MSKPTIKVFSFGKGNEDYLVIDRKDFGKESWHREYNEDIKLDARWSKPTWAPKPKRKPSETKDK